MSRTIKNNTGSNIMVAGNDISGEGVRKIILRPGQTSRSKLSDADAVIIMPGQLFYKSIYIRSAANIAEAGAIKVRDGVGNAEVAVGGRHKGKPVFYVNAIWTTYKTPAKATKEGWGYP